MSLALVLDDTQATKKGSRIPCLFIGQPTNHGSQETFLLLLLAASVITTLELLTASGTTAIRWVYYPPPPPPGESPKQKPSRNPKGSSTTRGNQTVCEEDSATLRSLRNDDWRNLGGRK